ncbi:MAG TPA: acyl carrier protein [Candidatus Dormibacteraeota bacterium]|nr:acyl carrier protein [Candidatus Dormibacteraeota bacterium]
MSDTNVFQKVRATVAATFHVSPEEIITSETTSTDVDGWDSLSHSILLMNVEEAFGIELPFEAAYELANVGELGDLVIATLAEKKQAAP